MSDTGTDHADAELIRLCAEHVANLAAYSHSDDPTDCDDPLWQTCLRTEAAINALPPKTLAGVVAKARVAKAEAIETSAEAAEVWEGTSGAVWARLAARRYGCSKLAPICCSTTSSTPTTS